MIRMLMPLVLLLPVACASTPGARSTGSDTAAHAMTPADPTPHGHDPRLRASQPASPSPVAVALDSATLAALPREAVSANAHGKALRCEGVPLLALLRASGAMPAEPLGGAQLARYVLIDARDGYRAVYALAELDPTLGNNRVFVVDRCDGQPLANDDGPLRLIAPDESRPARWVRHVKAVTVIVAP